MRYVIYNTENGEIVRHGEAGTPREAALQIGLSLSRLEVGLVPDQYTGIVSDIDMFVRNEELVRNIREDDLIVDEIVACGLMPYEGED